MPLGFPFGFMFDGAFGSGTTAPAGPRTIATPLWINDTPLQRYGVHLRQPRNWQDGLARVLPSTTPFPGMTAGRYAGVEAGGPRDVELEGTLLGVRHGFPLEQQQQALSAFTRALSGLLELRWAHAPTHVMRGVAGPVETEPVVPDKAFVNPDVTALRVRVVIRCADTAIWSRYPRRVRLSTTPALLPMGDLAVGGEITLQGPLTGDVDLDLLSPSGARLKRLALREVSLADGDTLVIRKDAPNLLTKYLAAGGEPEDVYHWRSLSESDRWWKVPPAGTDPDRAQWHSARLSTGAGWWVYHTAFAH